MGKIILTGSTGFVDTNLIPHLIKDDCEVEFLNRSDLISDPVLKNSSSIIHLAGKAHDIKKVSRPEEYYEVNFELTKRLYDAFLISDTEKFIFVSSVKAVADIVDGVLTEETNSNPQTHYGKSKLMAEDHIRNQVLSKGKSYYILRPCMIHGPGNKGNLNMIYQIGKRGIPYPLAAYRNRRSFVSVENMCFVISEFLNNNFPSGIYNIADNDPLSTNEIMQMIYEEHGFRNRLVSLPKSIVKFGARMGDWLHLPLNTERLQKMTEDYVVSNKKLIETLCKPLPISAKDGMRLTIKSFKQGT